MIIVRLHGGLGNQLFQYAFAKAYARRVGTALKVDAAWYQNGSRSYGLNLFDVQTEEAGQSDYEFIARYFWPIYRSTHRYAQRLRRWLGQASVLRGYLAEPTFHYAPILPKNNVYLDGYWQCERYFEDVTDELRAELTQFVSPMCAVAQQILQRIQAAKSVCVHVRRGDFVGHPLCRELSIDYYEGALYQLEQRIGGDYELFIFSDDIDWCRENLRFSQPCVFVSDKDSMSLRDEFELMLRCCHQIIANSTLSWWAAWLNPHPDKVVVAPREWFKPNTLSSQDLVPDAWLKC